MVHSYVEDSETPVSAFLKLRGDGPCFLLESAEQGGRLGRYSFLGFSPRLLLRWADGELLEWIGDDASAPAGEPTARSPAPDPYAAVAERIGGLELAGGEDLPFPGAAVGLFGYDLVRTVEPLGPPNPDPLGLPDLALMVPELIVSLRPSPPPALDRRDGVRRRGRGRRRAGLRAGGRADRPGQGAAPP